MKNKGSETSLKGRSKKNKMKGNAHGNAKQFGGGKMSKGK